MGRVVILDESTANQIAAGGYRKACIGCQGNGGEFP